MTRGKSARAPAVVELVAVLLQHALVAVLGAELAFVPVRTELAEALQIRRRQLRIGRCLAPRKDVPLEVPVEDRDADSARSDGCPSLPAARGSRRDTSAVPRTSSGARSESGSRLMYFVSGRSGSGGIFLSSEMWITFAADGSIRICLRRAVQIARAPTPIAALLRDRAAASPCGRRRDGTSRRRAAAPAPSTRRAAPSPDSRSDIRAWLASNDGFLARARGRPRRRRTPAACASSSPI